MKTQHCCKCGLFLGKKTHACPKKYFWSGKKHSNKTKEKDRIAHLGKHSSPKTEFKKGIIPWNKGKVFDFMKGNRFAVGNTPNITSFKKGHRSWLKGTKGLISHSLEWKKKMSNRFKGENSPCWKNFTPLKNLLRESFEYKQWRKSVFERDDYVCQECFKRDGKLHLHHIKSFGKIFNEFLQVYSQFSPIEDKETLQRLAVYYQPFWDIANGRTLCKECHKKTDNYLIFKGRIE